MSPPPPTTLVFPALIIPSITTSCKVKLFTVIYQMIFMLSFSVFVATLPSISLFCTFFAPSFHKPPQNSSPLFCKLLDNIFIIMQSQLLQYVDLFLFFLLKQNIFCSCSFGLNVIYFFCPLSLLL